LDHVDDAEDVDVEDAFPGFLAGDFRGIGVGDEAVGGVDAGGMDEGVGGAVFED
jgi:hypothetical protein